MKMKGNSGMQEPLAEFHNVANFVGALASACENNLGRGSLSICTLAGKKFGKEAMTTMEQTDDPARAIEILRRALAERGIVWEFEVFTGKENNAVANRNGKHSIRLVFHTCMVRNALFRYAHEQKLSLCHMAHGVFAGAIEEILPGYRAILEIVHAGPNACLKELVLEAKE
jgi:hypothetical protein